MVRILIADDHPVVRQGLRISLEENPEWEICGEASNGRMAADLARRLKPDVVVMDLSMPELNGLETTRIVREDNPSTEVLIFTLHQSQELLEEVRASGAKGFVLKSDPTETLRMAVAALSEHLHYVTGTVMGTSRGDGAGKKQGGALLTAREREVVHLVADGLRTREIAEHLGISEKTVESHRSAIMRKLHVDTVVDIVRFAIRHNIVQA
jgi:DNA-binding NarL/FixJ family response regulator